MRLPVGAIPSRCPVWTPVTVHSTVAVSPSSATTELWNSIEEKAFVKALIASAIAARPVAGPGEVMSCRTPSSAKWAAIASWGCSAAHALSMSLTKLCKPVRTGIPFCAPRVGRVHAQHTRGKWWSSVGFLEVRVGLSGPLGGLLIADHVPGGEGAAFESTLDPPDERGCDVAAG